MASPENYNQMLSNLGWSTLFTTFLFLVYLKFVDIIPKIEINHDLVPTIQGYNELIEWCLSFGAIPIVGAGIAWLLSSYFEVHNKLSKLILLRYIWDKYFIILPMLKRVGLEENLSRKRVKEIMEGLYYPEVKKIDQHYVHVFWRYALFFWILFEHFWVVLMTTLLIYFFYNSLFKLLLIKYLVFVFTLATVNWLFVVSGKSKNQADQIPEEAIILFFNI